MKIVHVCLSGRFNDNWGYQENILSDYNCKSGNKVSVIAGNIINCEGTNRLKKVKCGEYKLKTGVKIIRIPYHKFMPAIICEKLKIYENLFIKLKKEKPDLIFHHGSIGLTLLTVTKYVKKYHNCKLIIDNHADKFNSGKSFISRIIFYKGIWKFCMKKTIPYTHKYFGVLPIRCDFLSDTFHIPKNKIDLMIMGVDDEVITNRDRLNIRKEIRKKLNVEENDFLIISGGKIDVRKNIHLLMDAVTNMNRRNVKLLIFGTIDNNMKDIINSKLNSNIKFIGWIEAKNVYDYYIASDLVCFPGTHSVLWEQACAIGLPGVYNYMEGMQHVDINGNCRFIKHPTEKKLRDMLLKIIDNKDIYEQMKERAERTAYKKFLYSDIEKKMFL